MRRKLTREQFLARMAAGRAAAAKRRGAAAPARRRRSRMHKRQAKRRCNPSELLMLTNPTPGGAVAQAVAAYKRFHGVAPVKARRLAGSGPPLVALGQLREVVYQPTRGDRKGPAFFHRFGRGAVLAADPSGKHLFLVPSVGKPFRVDWERGIVG